jgi:tripartite-type tricarboxylate transporter receptor subunit TctC
VQLVCLPDAALTAYIKGGQVRPLAISTAQRQAELPNLPTLAETFAGFEYTGWNGLFAPAGTPADVVARVNRDLETVLKQPEVAQRMLALGSIVEQRMSVQEFDGFMRGERERWGKVVKTLGIQPE